MNGRVIRSVAVVAGLLLSSGTAFAEISSGSSALGNTQGKGTRGGLLNYNKTRFGVPDPADGNKVGAMKIGGTREVNLAQGTTNLGPCEVTGSVGQIKGELSAGIGAKGEVGKKPTGAGGAGAGGAVQCNASVEANLVSVEATCKTAIGTIKPSVKGPGGSAGCSCGTGCSAELYWAKAGVEYTTPAVGGCGIKVSATVGAEVMAGVAAGAEKVGTVGGKVKVGPVGVTAGINVEEFDAGKAADCVVDALEDVGEAVVAVADRAAEIGTSVVNGIADAGSAVAEGVSNFFGGLFGGGDDEPSVTSVVAYGVGMSIDRETVVYLPTNTPPAESVRAPTPGVFMQP